MSAPLGRLRLPWVDLPLFGLLLACAPVCALPDLPEQVGLGPGGASLLERAALPQDLVYEALSEEWRKRDGEDDDPWENHGPDGYQPPSYEPVNPERRTAQTPSDGLI